MSTLISRSHCSEEKKNVKIKTKYYIDFEAFMNSQSGVLIFFQSEHKKQQRNKKFGLENSLNHAVRSSVFFFFSKRASLLGNEEIHLVGDSTIFEFIYPNLEQRSVFAKKSTLFYVRNKILVK